MCRFLLILLIIPLGNAIHAEEFTIEQMKKLGNQIFDYREKLEKFDSKIDYERQSFLNEKKETYNTRYIYRVDGDRLYYEKISYPIARDITCKDGDYKGYVFRFRSTLDGDVKYGSFDKGTLEKTDHVFILKNVGLHAFRFSNGNTLTREGFLKTYFSYPATQKKVVYREREVSHLSVDTSNTKFPFPNLEMWIDLERGPSILKIKQWNNQGGYTMEALYPKEKTFDYWFPSEVQIKHEMGGKNYITDKLQIAFESINKPIDPKLFLIANMNLPEGTIIQNDPFNNKAISVINDKNELVPPDAFGTPEPEPKERSKWWGRAAIITAVLTLIVGVIYLRKRRLQNSLGGE